MILKALDLRWGNGWPIRVARTDWLVESCGIKRRVRDANQSNRGGFAAGSDLGRRLSEQRGAKGLARTDKRCETG